MDDCECDRLRCSLKWPFYVLKLPQFSLSPIKLINCDGGTGHGVKFSQSSVQVDYIYDTDEYGYVYPFTEIFLKGNAILMDYINLTKKPSVNSISLKVLEILLSFIMNIEETAKALCPIEEQSSEGKDGRSETEWSARLAVHFLSSLSLTQDYIIHKQSSKKCEECPCSCKRVIKYGDTSIGHPRTWYGHFDILIGEFGNEKGKVKMQGPGSEVNVGATVVPEEADDKSDTSLELDAESLDECSSQVDELQSHLSQLISQTIVFSFYQKKCEPALDLVPSIGVSKSHIQFHFYDCEKDIYLLSREMPLFYADDNKSLNITTVIATWLVLNHRHLISGASDEMSEGKFGFHSKISQDILHLFKHDIEMGLTMFKPYMFKDNILLKRYKILGKETEVIDAKYPKTCPS